MTPIANRPAKNFGFAQAEDVLREVRNPARRIEFIRILFADILGRPMEFSFPASELEAAFREGKGFDGSSVEGFVRIEESDLIIQPDPKTFRHPHARRQALRRRQPPRPQAGPGRGQEGVRLRRLLGRPGAGVLHLPQ